MSRMCEWLDKEQELEQMEMFPELLRSTTCPYCGREVPVHAAKCPKCGERR